MLIVVLDTHVSFAQTNNFWCSEYFKGFTFDSVGNFKLFNNLIPDYNLIGNSASIADNSGYPLLIRASTNVYNSKGVLIGNGQGLKVGANLRTNSYLVQIDTSTFLTYDQGVGYYDSIFSYSIIKKDKTHKSGFLISDSQKNRTLIVKGFKSICFCRNEKANVYMIIRAKDYFYSFILAPDGSINKLDSFYYPEQNLYPLAYKQNSKIKLSPVNSILKMSIRGDKIVFSENWTASINNGLSSKVLFFSQAINTLKFNKINGAFYGYEQLILDTVSYYSSPSMNISIIYNLTETLNEDVFCSYVINSELNLGNKTISESIIQYELSSKAFRVIFKEVNKYNFISTSNGMSLNHLGQLYFFSNSQSNALNINLIESPGTFQGGVVLVKNIYTIPSNVAYQFQVNKWPHHIFDLARIKIKINYTCSATVSVYNNCFKEGKFTNFKWFIQDDSGLIKEFEQFEPPVLRYKHSGTYLVRLFATDSIAGGYGEWYTDSLRIRIPTKPVPDFYLLESKICMFENVKFYNTSYSKSILKNTYYWKFGDSSYSTQESPTHRYSKVGKYSVSLFYSNGYCDSSKLKEYYVEVVGSPQSGFIIDKTFGCAPFKINIIDTNSQFVSSRQYQFGDSIYNYQTTQNIISHNYLTPGKYFIRQILKGYSSCKATSDSVWINVLRGINKSDTSHIINASIEDESLNLLWNSVNGAVKYQVLINGRISMLSKDTFLFFKFNYNNPNKFEVFAIDSCDNLSSIGRYGMPIYLKGEVNGNNQYALLKYTPYKNWRDSVKFYRIQKFVNNMVWITISETNFIVNYMDEDFAKLSENGCLYRVEAQSQLGLITHSNTIYLNYFPQIYVPNSFSPNNDGINDVFFIDVLGVKSYSYSIINQWGEIVYKGNNENPKWSGDEVFQGVYAIVIEYKTNSNESNIYRGTLTLLK